MQASMDASLRIVTRLPLGELWRDDGPITTARGRSLGKHEIVDLLKAGPVQFVMANIGDPLLWVEISECYRFWKDEVKPHLAETESKVPLDEFPGFYCYFSSEWKGPQGSPPIVVLEMQH